VGSLFYFYSRYGFYRIEDIIDIAVAVMMVVFAFGGSFLIYSVQFRFNVKELEQSLNILHEDASASETLLALKKKSIRMTIAKIIAFMVGLGLFVYLLASYMSR
jgi:divalent metal cation (Fe/Co/Zn/Cd) transporter